MKVDSLRVEQDLRQQGLDHDLAMFTADLQYRIMSGREKIDAEMFMFLKQLDAQIKQQNKGGGLGGFLGKIVGGVVGAATGGIGGAIGNAVGGLFGGGEETK
jgi:phage tail tape-measure protein